MMSAQRVLCFCEKWESGGIEAFVTSSLECMDRSGLEIDLAACVVKPGPYDERLARMGIEPVVLGESVRTVASNLHAFEELVSRRRYDVVHLNLYEGLALLFARAAKRSGVSRVIVHSHNNDIRPGAFRQVKLALHYACVAVLGGYADDRWAPSKTTARFLFGTRPWTLVKNGICPREFAFDPTVRASVRAELGLSDRYAIGCVGRLCAQKNQPFLLDVIERLDNVVLLLIGDDDSGGETLAVLKDGIARRNLSDRVVRLGGTRHVARLYQAMDALCMPSLFEGLGIVAVEAQAAGLPVVASPAVPPEARVCDLFRTVPLDASAWADALRAVRGTERVSMVEAVEEAGYDMQAVSAFIRSAFFACA